MNYEGENKMRKECPCCKESMLENFPEYVPRFFQEYFSYCPKCKAVYWTDDET
jgi:uncharacterized protein with PIN domain